MSCKNNINLCYLRGEDFKDQQVTFNEDVSGFVFEIYGLNGVKYKTITPTQVGNTAYILGVDLKDLKDNQYRGEFFFVRNGKRKLAFYAAILITSDPSRVCCPSTMDFVIKDETTPINLTISETVTNIGDGAGVNLDGYLKTTVADEKYQPKGNYALKSDIPTIPPPQDLTPYATKSDLSAEVSEREKIGTTVNNNAQNIALNSQSVQQISQNVSLNSQAVQSVSQAVASKAEKSYVDSKFTEIIGSAPEALNTIYELAAEMQREGGVIESLTATIGKKADITWVTQNFQPVGNYLQSVDLLPYVKTADANTNYAAKNHTHSYNDLTDKPTIFSGNYADLAGKPTLFSGSWSDLSNKPTLFSGKYADLNGIPSTFAPSAHTHVISEVTGLQTALDGKAAASHTHPTVTNSKDNSQVTIWAGSKTDYDALATKPTGIVLITS